jgi:hypothetical protein
MDGASLEGFFVTVLKSKRVRKVINVGNEDTLP